MKKKGNRNTSLFSLFNYWTYQRDAAQAVDNVFEDSETKEEIRKQILLENYYPTEFDILLLFSGLVILLSNTVRNFLLSNKKLNPPNNINKSYLDILLTGTKLYIPTIFPNFIILSIAFANSKVEMPVQYTLL